MTSDTAPATNTPTRICIGVARNGFVMSDESAGVTSIQRGQLWAFSTAQDLLDWMKWWGEGHHPVADVIVEDDPEAAAAADCADRNAPRAYIFAVLVSGKSFFFDELMTPSKRAEILTEIKSISDGHFQIFEPANEPSQTVRAIHGFRAAFAYLLAKYPGLIHWNDAARIAF